MPTGLLSTSEDRVMVLALFSADGRNLLTADVCAAGVEALNLAADSSDVEAVVITGTGAHFSGGEDLEALRASLGKRGKPGDAMHRGTAGSESDDWVEAIATFPKPILAAVEGTVAGAGFALALACDLIVAGGSTEFSLPHGAAGMLPPAGTIRRLVRGLPAQLVSELLLDGSPMTAGRLHGAGLVNRLVPDGVARIEAVAWASRLGAGPASILADTKELIDAARMLPPDAYAVRESGRRLFHLHRCCIDSVPSDAAAAPPLLSPSSVPWIPHS